MLVLLVVVGVMSGLGTAYYLGLLAATLFGVQQQRRSPPPPKNGKACPIWGRPFTFLCPVLK